MSVKTGGSLLKKLRANKEAQEVSKQPQVELHPDRLVTSKEGPSQTDLEKLVGATKKQPVTLAGPEVRWDYLGQMVSKLKASLADETLSPKGKEKLELILKELEHFPKNDATLGKFMQGIRDSFQKSLSKEDFSALEKTLLEKNQDIMDFILEDPARVLSATNSYIKDHTPEPAPERPKPDVGPKQPGAPKEDKKADKAPEAGKTQESDDTKALKQQEDQKSQESELRASAPKFGNSGAKTTLAQGAGFQSVAGQSRQAKLNTQLSSNKGRGEANPVEGALQMRQASKKAQKQKRKSESQNRWYYYMMLKEMLKTVNEKE